MQFNDIYWSSVNATAHFVLFPSGHCIVSPSINRFWFNMTGVTSGAELLTLPEHLCSPPLFSWVRVARSIVLCLVFCRSFFLLLTIFYCPLHCLSSFDLPLLTTPLGSFFLVFLRHFSLTKSSVREVTELMDNKQLCKLAH